MMRKLAAAALLLFVLTACSPAPSPEPRPPAETEQPPAQLDGAALVEERCTVCHSRDRIDGAVKTRDGWRTTVQEMRARGADVNDEEAAAIVDYLAERDANRQQQ